MTGSPPAFAAGRPPHDILPPASLPLRHFAFAAVSLFIFSVAFLLGSGRILGLDSDPRWTVGLVHILTLGWVNMSILGALVQMTPVHGQVPLAAPPAWISAAWWAYVFGLAGFVGLLWSGSPSYWIPGLLIALSMGVYVYVLAKTSMAAPKRDWTGTHVRFALAYLVILAALGALLAYDKRTGLILARPDGAFIAHIHAALVGWVSLVIFGVSYRMVPFFSMARMRTKWPSRAALALANVGLLGLIADCLLTGGVHIPLWAALLALAYASYLYQAAPWVSPAPRRWDPSLCLTALGLAGGLLWASLGLSLALGWLEDGPEARSAYVYAALVGWATPYILGQAHRIVPFLVWRHVYAPREGAAPAAIPTIDALTSRPLAWAELGLMVPAVGLGTLGLLLGVGSLLKAGALSLALAAGLYLINSALSLRHLLRLPGAGRQRARAS